LILITQVSFAQDVTNTEAVNRIRISHIDFKGNDTYQDVVLRDIIASEQPGMLQRFRMHRKQRWFFDEEELQRDAIRIERFYRRRGFTEPRISYTVETGKKSWQRKVIFDITEGPFIRLDELTLQWETDSSTADKVLNSSEYARLARRLPLREGRRYEPILETETAGILNSVLRNVGYAFSRTSMVTEIDSTKLSATSIVTINPGALGHLDSILVEGATTARESLLLKEAGLHLGDQFSQRKLDDAQRQLYSHHLIRFVTVGLPEQPEDSTVKVRLRLREHPLRKVEVLGGFGNRELFRAQVNWTHRNAFGLLHSFGTTGRVTFISQRASVDYLIPYVFNSSSSIFISPFVERRLEPAYLLRRGGIRNAFIYQYGYRFTSNVAYTFSGNKLDVYNERATLPDDALEYTISSLELSALYAEQSFTAQRGWVLRPSIELSGLFNTGDYVYQKMFMDARRYIDITPRFQVALRGVSGFLFGARADSLPPSILYNAGGFGSVRGWYVNQLGPKRALYDEEGVFDRYVPIGGRYLLAFSGETRIGLNRILPNLGFSTFVDGGQIWQKWPGYPNQEKRAIQYGVGGGIYYITPVGPIRFDVAYKVNPTNEDLNIVDGVNLGKPIDRWGFHFSLGQSF